MLYFTHPSLRFVVIEAFDQCSSLTDVCYGASQKRWNEIEIGQYNDPLLNAVIHFSLDPAGLVISSIRAAPGDTVTLTVSLAEPVQIKSLVLEAFTFDDAALTLINAQWKITGALDAQWDPEAGTAEAVFAENTQLEGTIFTLTFRIGDGIEGDFEVGMTAQATVLPEEGPETALRVNLTKGAVHSAGYIRGDMDGDGEITSDDAIYLLRHTLMPDKYPLVQPGDISGDGLVTSDDAVYLLRHTLSPIKYPIS